MKGQLQPTDLVATDGGQVALNCLQGLRQLVLSIHVTQVHCPLPQLAQLFHPLAVVVLPGYLEVCFDGFDVLTCEEGGQRGRGYLVLYLSPVLNQRGGGGGGIVVTALSKNCGKNCGKLR